ncbi:putative deoxynucleoside monophosphate kinase [Erwinia phage Faunus]|uniref:Putative deoxynucleoside monophosphate kinase n=1 Tax=Erwinia phage Faunus TaxID=2182346 RepID=A0A2U8UWJ3_9CAUD|nr:putative deoxynucleoside monophosphate kinase [Erwinia phage Faunus]AWN08625.1 putative deoxynucleoside monophosphate kinase [Erwinia phage Faunus]
MKNHSINLMVVLNGPPGCGKDTIANEIVSQERIDNLGWPRFVKHQFKDALYEHTAEHFQVDLDKFIHFASDRELKDSRTLAGLGERTPRQALIHVSEEVYKPRYGNDYFGKVEASRVSEHKGNLGGIINVIYPDGGFESEIPPVESEFDACLIIRLHRDGFDFKGDSRNYINLPNTETRKTVDVHILENEIELGVKLIQQTIRDFHV